MTPKERRLVFTYSKICGIDHELNHCATLLASEVCNYEKEKAGLEPGKDKIGEIRNKIADIEAQFDAVKDELGAIVNSLTEYEQKEGEND